MRVKLEQEAHKAEVRLRGAAMDFTHATFWNFHDAEAELLDAAREWSMADAVLRGYLSAEGEP